jgi:hypothetical protein
MNTEIVSRLHSSFERYDQEEMIRRATQEAVTSSADPLAKALSKLHILPVQLTHKPQLSDEELSHPSADKEEKSK